MVYGSGLWGVTEANYAVVLVHLYTYLIGPAGWTTKPLSGLGSKCFTMGSFEFPCTILSNLMINDILLLTFGLMGASLFFQQVVRVFKLSGSDVLLKTTLPQEERGFKQLGYRAALSHLLQILWTCLGCGMVLMLPLVPPVHSRVVFEIFGINYALQATRMIMAHMSKEPFQIAVWPNLLIGFQILNYYLGFFDQIFVAYFVLVGIACGYLFYISSIIWEICTFLGISALTIKQSKKDWCVWRIDRNNVLDKKLGCPCWTVHLARMKNCDLFCAGKLPSGLLFIYLITCQYQIIALKGVSI